MTPTASIVVPCFNVADTLDEQLVQLLPQVRAANAELILVDNNSSDRTPQLLHRAASDAHVIAATATAKQGASHARNIGVSRARAERLLFCDADDVVGDGWVQTLIDALDDHEVVTGSLQTDHLNSTTLARSRHSSRSEASSPATFYGLFPIVHGGNMAVRRDAWDAIGPLDESLPAIEDVEWALRAHVSGRTVTHVPAASVGYRYRTSPTELFRQGLRYGRNRPRVARLAFESIGQRPARLAGLRSWAWMVSNMALLRSRDGRARLAWVAGNRLGNLRGSLDAKFLVL